MSGEIIRKGDSTSHGGTVVEGSLTDICHGKPIAFLGHKVYCPKCNGIFPIIEGVMIMTFYGKGVAVAGMKTSCGAILIPTQFTDTVEIGAGTGAGASAPSRREEPSIAAGGMPSILKSSILGEVVSMFWTYGELEIPVSGISRFHVDLNLHIETKNYAAGEVVEIVVENDEADEVVVGSKKLTLQAIVGADGKGKIKNVFEGMTVTILELSA